MVKAPFPMNIMNHGHPRRFHHGTPQIAPPLFGDTPAAVFVGGIMDAGAQPRIADQLFCTWETLDISDRRQENHRGEHADADLLKHKGRLRLPGFAKTFQIQPLFDLFDQRRQMIEDL
jgi:hypothetical protein